MRLRAPCGKIREDRGEQMSEVHVNLSGFDRFLAAVQAGSEPIRRAWRQIAAIYRGAMKERFVTNSRGGGDWPDLKDSTKRRRRGPRKGFKGTRIFAILRDTDKLLDALDPRIEAPGSLIEDLPFGVRVGFGGPARHPKGKATISDIASFHHFGEGHLPVRTLLVDPSAATNARMVSIMDAAVKKTADDTQI